MTARLLAAAVGTPSRGDEHWVTTLRACSAHEAYLRTYQRALEPRLVLEFLLLDRLFPRSVLHALRVGEEALARLEPAAEWNGRFGQAPEARRLIGRVRTDLEFLSPRGADPRPAGAAAVDPARRLGRERVGGPALLRQLGPGRLEPRGDRVGHGWGARVSEREGSQRERGATRPEPTEVRGRLRSRSGR